MYMGTMHTLPIDAHTLLTAWPSSVFPVAVAVVLVAMTAWYVLAVRKLAQRDRSWSGWRTVSFVAGLVSVELALGSSVATVSMFSFTGHVIQHLLLMIIGPPLLALGAPMTLLLQT